MVAADRRAEAIGFPDPPPSEQVVADFAGLLDAEAAARVAESAAREASPDVRIVVVTIASLDDHGARGWEPASWARALFEAWAAAAGAGAGEIPRERTVLVVLVARERRVVVVPGSAFLQRGGAARDVEQVFAYWLDRGDPEAAVEHGIAAARRFAAGEAISVPGSLFAVVAIVVGFVVFGLSTVDYLRKGPTCVSYRIWSRFFSVLSAAITWSLTRSVDIGTGLGRAASGEPATAETAETAVLGRW